MNPDKQRIALSKWLDQQTGECSHAYGWTQLSPNKFQCNSCGIRQPGGAATNRGVNIDSLDAVHALTIKLREQDWNLYNGYVTRLRMVIAIENSKSDARGWFESDATAAQRCEALLKTLNLWTE